MDSTIGTDRILLRICIATQERRAFARHNVVLAAINVGRGCTCPGDQNAKCGGSHKGQVACRRAVCERASSESWATDSVCSAVAHERSA